MKQPEAIVITGASTGIGRACALHFDKLGYRVFADVRNEADGDALQVAASVRLTPIILDVTNDADIANAERVVNKAIGNGAGKESELTGLINNAGIAVGGPLEYLPIAQVRQQIEINVIGAVAVTQAFLPLLRHASHHSRATVVNISSISGRFAAPFLGPYAASKFALEALSDALRLELRPAGIRVVSIEPGPIATPIWEKSLAAAQAMRQALPPIAEENYGPALDFMLKQIRPNQGIPAIEVAQVVEKAITRQRPRARYLVGPGAWVPVLMSHLPTRLRDWLVASRLPKYG
ncbi:SDR family oxidoreductase [Chloroflexi bacterium TSY]|nr:SDR family oxidoreductase [Chloroflexi bacterium TSY]